MIHWFRRA